jgi:hypothetical protein
VIALTVDEPLRGAADRRRCAQILGGDRLAPFGSLGVQLGVDLAGEA